MDESNRVNSVKTVGDQINESLKETLIQIEHGFRRVMLLYTIAFFIGIGLIIVAIIPIFMEVKSQVYSIIFGTMGIIDLTAFVIFKPVEDLQYSRGNLARIMTAFASWFNEVNIWNQYVAKRSAGNNLGITFKEMSKISEINISNTLKILESSGYSLKVTKTDKKDEK